MSPERLCFRLAAVDFDGRAALAGLDSLDDDALPDEDFLLRYCARTMNGVERLCEWQENHR